jgi:type II secretory pathway pseudopilin PulG
MSSHCRNVRQVLGFTLVEIAIVLMIVALFIGALLVPLSAQVTQRRTDETVRALNDISEALIGYAAANGRLPCPASMTSLGQESFAPGKNATDGTCSKPFDGFVPAVDLGIRPTDPEGFAVDGWGIRIRYAVTTDHNSAFTRINGMKDEKIEDLDPELRVCVSATGVTTTSCGTSTVLANKAPVVLLSLGANGVSGIHGADEGANLDGNAVFVYHTPAPVGAAGGEFDDLVTWLSPNILYSRMIAAGRLP